MREFHEIFTCLKGTQAISYSYQITGKPLQTGSLKHDVKEFMAHFPADKVLEIAMDYLANDEEVRQSVAYVQSEEFPKIHNIVEQLQGYKT
jgi:hypothetical protein